jgi:hypothetical protein
VDAQATEMTELLTLEEIGSRHPDEWVLLGDIEADPGPVVRRGRVLWHSADQDECWLKAIEIAAPNMGVFYLGPWSAEDEPIPVL